MQWGNVKTKMLNYEGLLNPAKAHLWALPTMDKPVPEYPGKSKQGVMIIPIFLTRPGDTSIEHHIVKSAAWARRSWIIFSDAEELDISIKFYVELKVADRVLPLLHENNVDVNTQVLYFDGSATMGEPMNHLGQKLAMFGDDQFNVYDWVWQLDSDNFLASPKRDKFPYFASLLELPQQLAACEVHPFKDYMTLWNQHWWNYLLDDSHSDNQKHDEWLRRASLVCDSETALSYTKKGTGKVTVGGGLYGFPAKQFYDTRQAECEWLVKAGKIMQDDEAVFSLYISMGNHVTSLIHEIDVPVNVVGEEAENHARPGTHFMNHIGRLDYEHCWRESFDSL